MKFSFDSGVLSYSWPVPLVLQLPVVLEIALGPSLLDILLISEKGKIRLSVDFFNGYNWLILIKMDFSYTFDRCAEDELQEK